MIKKYRVVFLGLRENEEDFKREMSKLGVSSETVDHIIQKAPVEMKGEMTLGGARQYAEAIQNAGGKVNIQESGSFEEPDRLEKPFEIKSFESFTMCPECGLKQLKTEACVKCGFRLDERSEGSEEDEG